LKIYTRIAGVAECAVIGVKDIRWGERPLALIVRDPKMTPPASEEDIKAHVLSYSKKGVISKFAVPQQILFVEALAKTSVGKFDKKALRAQYGEGA
jgi:fatty-acyl-CoA synthase